MRMDHLTQVGRRPLMGFVAITESSRDHPNRQWEMRKQFCAQGKPLRGSKNSHSRPQEMCTEWQGRCRENCMIRTSVKNNREAIRMRFSTKHGMVQSESARTRLPLRGRCGGSDADQAGPPSAGRAAEEDLKAARREERCP